MFRTRGLTYERKGFLDDLVNERYCYSEDLDIVLEDLKDKKLDVVRVGEKYFLALFENTYYFIDCDIHLFSPGSRESPIHKIERIDARNNSLILSRAESSSNSEFLGRLYSIVKNYYRKIEKRL